MSTSLFKVGFRAALVLVALGCVTGAHGAQSSTNVITGTLEKVDSGAKLILYCGGGFRSALVAENLQKMGYTNVESMDGGWKGWLDAGLPVAKD